MLGLSLGGSLLAGSAQAQTVAIPATSYPVPTDGTARFIAPTGNDTTGTGTEAKPWRSLKKAFSAPAGSTIVCRGGTYRGAGVAEQSLGKRLTIQAYPGEQVWFKGSLVVKGWVAEGSIWRKDNWTYQFARTMAAENIDTARGPLAGWLDMAYYDGARLEQVAAKAEVGPGKFYVDYTTKQLYIGDNPGDHTVEATAYKRSITVWKSPNNDPTGTIIRGVGFAHYAETGVGLGAPQVRLEKNAFVWNGITGLSFYGSGGPVDALVTGNVAAYNGQTGMAGSSAHRLRLENNVIRSNNVERFRRAWSAAGVKLIAADSVVVRGNTVEDNDAHAIWLDVNMRHATVVGNTVRRNSQFGIFFEISRGCLIAGNVCAGNGAGVAVANSSDVRVYNNTLVSNNKALLIKEDNRTPSAAEQAAGATFLTRRTVVKNNILSEAGNSNMLVDTWRACSDTAAAMITALDYNAYYRADVAQPANIIKWTAPGVRNGCHTSYKTLPNLREVTGFEGNGLELSGATNPFFVSPAADGSGNYQLKNGSSNPAFRRGQPLPQDVAQALGVPAGVPVDLGALFGAGSYGNAQTIASLTLLNADTDQPISGLIFVDGTVLNLATLPSRNLSIRVNTNPGTVGSVRFTLDGTVLRTENAVPYAIAGDSNGNYGAWTPSLGQHTLTVTPYSAANAGGTAGPARTYSFSVVEQLGTNLGFEAGGAETGNPVAWTSTGAIDADYTQTGTPHGGTLKGVHWKNSAYEVYTSQLIQNLPNGLYTLRAWVRRGDGTGTVRMQAEQYGGSLRTADIAPKTWNWTQVTIADINVTNGQVRIGFYSNAQAGKYLHFDDVELVRQTSSSSTVAARTAPAATATAAEVAVFPNPAAGQFIVRLPAPAADTDEAVRITLTNTLGQRVLEREATATDSREVTVDAGPLRNGVYLLTVQRGQTTSTHRVEVAR
ncbi:right-handed parallel beta-helix repeat-containing protein [Hymenobacter weizhouensis]|uniref:right-handed parallel beta-helix repeat-containing protein n=1 Tax=Hymenobacter sp. YIM 151500-1 TaxID=2987689 RepID=UPI0022275F04|nr:right-handed parallel beta-helix repeat-containing protein [Hymenobacter sp. YIM 151500-1]UYZ63895.1 right-handed parallel beta-helix repeat-containing protein [Hymenobacter sp. YIM 151500-1]